MCLQHLKHIFNYRLTRLNHIFHHYFLSIFSIEQLDLSDSHIKTALHFASDNLSNLQQLVEGDPSFLWILPKLGDEYVQPEWLKKLADELKNVEFKKPALVKMMRNFAKLEGLNFGQMMKTLRMLLSSQKDGYQVAEMMEILGSDGTIKRLLRIDVSNNKERIETSC